MCVASTKNVCLIIALNLLATIDCANNQRFDFKPRIVGGYVAKEIYPFMVSIREYLVFGRLHKCGGSIINARTVVTAAHCLAHTSASFLSVHVGENSRMVVEGEEYNVSAIYYNEKWNSLTQDYDVGLVRIEGSFTFGSTVQPIKLAGPKDRIPNGSYATVLGWGFTDPNNPLSSEVLMVAQVPIVRQTTCNRQMGGLITKRMICAGFKSGGVDACQMDSGGPLVANKKLIGIVSWGIGCGEPNKPGVYARVSELVPWIQHILATQFNETL